MIIKNGKHGGIVAFLAALLLVFAFMPIGAFADDAPALKALPVTPQIDPSADAGHKDAKPLQAGIQHNEKFNTTKPTPGFKASAAQSSGRGFMGKMRGGAKTATVDTLQGKTNNGGFNLNSTSGYGIIGVKFVLSVGKPPVINRVFAGTPAMKVGLQPNDSIVAVDGVPTYGLTKEEVYDLIIGSPGTSVNLSIMRAGDFKVVSCTRMDINDITDPLVRRDYLMSM